MAFVETGLPTIVLSTGFSAASSGAWVRLGAPYRAFGVRCVRGTTVGTSNFQISVRGSLSTHRSTGPAVGAIGAYGPSTVVNVTQALVGKIKLSTALVPANFVKAVCVSMTTATNRRVRVELVCLP